MHVSDQTYRDFRALAESYPAANKILLKAFEAFVLDPEVQALLTDEQAADPAVMVGLFGVFMETAIAPRAWMMFLHAPGYLVSHSGAIMEEVHRRRAATKPMISESAYLGF